MFVGSRFTSYTSWQSLLSWFVWKFRQRSGAYGRYPIISPPMTAPSIGCIASGPIMVMSLGLSCPMMASIALQCWLAQGSGVYVNIRPVGKMIPSCRTSIMFTCKRNYMITITINYVSFLTKSIQGVPQKAECSIFVTLIFEDIANFDFIR